MKYHGEIFDDGRDFMAIDSDPTFGPIVSIKFAVDHLTFELFLDSTQASELARHLAAATKD